MSFDMMFLRLMHVLAHHPDFSLESQNLQETAKSVRPFIVVRLQSDSTIRYIEFYLDLVGTADNIPLLYHLALKCKTVRDATSEEYSEVC